MSPFVTLIENRVSANADVKHCAFAQYEAKRSLSCRRHTSRTKCASFAKQTSRSVQTERFVPPKTKRAQTCSFLFWRRRRDLNPRASCPTYTLSRGASSPLEYFSKVKINFAIKISCGAESFPFRPLRVWRREWDSNPRGLAPKRFSRPPRYDRFDISPSIPNFYHLLLYCRPTARLRLVMSGLR